MWLYCFAGILLAYAAGSIWWIERRYRRAMRANDLTHDQRMMLINAIRDEVVRRQFDAEGMAFQRRLHAAFDAVEYGEHLAALRSNRDPWALYPAEIRQLLERRAAAEIAAADDAFHAQASKME